MPNEPDDPPCSDGKGMDQCPEALTIESKESHQQTVIFLHDHGARAEDWAEYLADLTAGRLPHARCVLPAAPPRPGPPPGGTAAAPQWYAVEGFEDPAEEPCEGLAETVRGLEALVGREEAAGVARRNVVLGGFGEGAAAALYTALQLTPPVGGVFALSGYLPTPHAAALRHPSLPVLLCHGAADRLVEAEGGTLRTEAHLRAAGFTRVTAKLYPGLGHWTQLQEWADVGQWLTAVWAPPDPAAPGTTAETSVDGEPP